MPGMDGTRLKTALASDFLAQIQAAFPVSSSLLTAEKAALNTAQQNLATALANAAGPDVVTEVKNAVVASGIAVATTGTAAAQTGSTTATGTVS